MLPSFGGLRSNKGAENASLNSNTQTSTTVGGGGAKQSQLKKVSKFSLTFANPSPVESRNCSKERPVNSLLSQIAMAQTLQQNAAAQLQQLQQQQQKELNQESFSNQPD